MENKILSLPIPEGTPLFRTDFTVTADEQEVGLYSDKTYWNGCVNFGIFGIAEGHAAHLCVRPHFAFESVKILPVMLGIIPQVTRGEIRFTVNRTPLQITLVFDDDYVSGHVLHLFADPMTEAPEPAENVLAFPAGFHDVRGEKRQAMGLSSGQTLYLAPGCVLYGGIRAEGEDIRICGGGMILTDGDCTSISLDAVGCTKLSIEGVTVHSHARNGWNVHLYQCTDVSVNDLKVVATTYACTDGIDVSNGQHVRVTNSFIRSCDDSISVKGLNSARACEDIRFESMILWNDCNSSMVVGEESRAAYYRDISFTDVDVLFSYDDPQYHEQLAERSVMSIVFLDGVACSGVKWERIRVNKCERLCCMVFRDNFWFGTVKGNQELPGGIDGVSVRDVRVFCDSGSRIADQILLEGWDAEKQIRNVDFRLVQIMGVEIDESYPRIQKNEFVESLTFSRTL